jgi:hypothetical protein
LQQCQQQALSIAKMTATCVPFYVVWQGVTTQTMVDCDEGAHAKQQPTKLYISLRKGATIRSDNIVDAMIMSYIVSQEATTMATMVDCNKQARL